MILSALLHRARLDPYAALVIDCPDIMRHTQTTEDFVQGFAGRVNLN